MLRNLTKGEIYVSATVALALGVLVWSSTSTIKLSQPAKLKPAQAQPSTAKPHAKSVDQNPQTTAPLKKVTYNPIPSEKRKRSHLQESPHPIAGSIDQPIESGPISSQINDILSRSKILKSRVQFDSETQQYVEETLIQSDLKYSHLVVKKFYSTNPRVSQADLIKETVQAADHFIVQISEGREREFENYMEQQNSSILRKMGPRPLYLIEVTKADFDIIENETKNLLASEAPVVIAEPDYLAFITSTTPDDPSYNLLWGMNQANNFDINAPEAWDYHTGGEAVTVAVIDSGVDYTHPDLIDNMWINTDEIPNNDIDDDSNGYVDDIYGYDFGENDDNPDDGGNHGTHVSGTIGAQGNNTRGVVGVNWNVNIMALRFIVGNSGFTSDAVEAVYYATDNGADLSNNSWGGNGFSSSLKNAIDDAGSNDRLFIAAAGNDFLDNDVTPFYPSSYNSANIIAVTSISSSGGQVYNYGDVSVDIGAPGYSIYSSIHDHQYGYANGTSMASPHVAGVCAVIKAAAPSLTYTQIKQSVLDGATPTASLTGKCLTGGRLNLLGSLADLDTPETPSSLYFTGVSSNSLDLSWTDNADNEQNFELERKEGSPYDIYDYANNNHDGILRPTTNTGPTFGQSGSSKYYEFDGTNDYVSLDSALLQGSTDFSVSLWFNADSLSGYQALVEGRDANDDGLRIILESDGSFLVSINTFDYTPATTISAGLWYNLIFVADRDGNKKIYLNGSEIFSGSGDSSLDTHTKWTLGRVAYNTAWFFDGKMSDVRLYNRLISGSEATSLYGGGLEASIDVISESSLEMFLAMDDTPSSWSLINQPSSNTTSYSDTSLNESTRYSYRLRAIGAQGNSTYSNIASTNTVAAGGGGGGSAPTAPSDLSITAAVTNQIDLAWTDNASDETSFKIERQNGDGSAEGTLSDESGNAHDGTVTQASWNSDATSGYYSFDGADDYISLNTPLLQGSSDFSVSLWFNADSLGSNQALLEGRDANDDGLRISLNTSGGFIISINTHDYFPATTVSAAQWNHLSFVADRDGNKVVYLNGTEIFSGSGDSALSTSSDWLLGRIAYTSAWHFDGDITGLRVYNRLLSAGEASTLFSSGRGAADDAVSTANLELFYSMAFPNGPWSQIDTVTSNVTTYVDSTVTANTTYSYRIRAANGFGNSTYSNIASTNTVAAGGGGGGSAPTAPSDLSITAAVTNQIDLAWTDNASDETSFKIERQNGDGSAEGTLSDESGNAHDGTVTQASWNSDATSGYYSFDGADDYISLNTPLLQGSSDFSVSLWFNADSLGSNQALLEGRDANDDGLRISLNTSGGFIISINTHDYFPATTVSAAQWNHLSFVADRDGNKVVYLNGTEIFSGSGDSALSTSSDWLLGRIAYTSAWHFDGDITGLRVYNRLLSAGEASTLFSSGRGAADDAVSTANLELFYSMAFPNGPWSQIDTVTSNVTTYVDSTVTANTTYSYRIRAANGFGNSTYSNIASTNTVAAGGGGGGSAPTAPSDLSITAAVTNQIDLAWTDNASDETSFKIERQNGDGSAEGTLSDESGNAHDGTVTQASWNSDATSGYYSFDGADDYISLNTPLLQGSSDFSVSLWFNADSLGSNQALLEGRDANDDGLRISLNTSGGFIISINTHDYFPATTVSAAQWNHLSFVADRDGNKVVYLNGTEIFSGSGDSALSTSSDWLLGRIAYTSAWHFDGDITGLRVYNRLLSAGEASTLFSSGRGAADDAVSTANLELFYSMAFPNGPWSQIDTVTSNVTTYVDSTVTANTTYSYRIRAANGFGNSTYSNIASTNTVAAGGGGGGSAPTAPSDLSITAAVTNQIDLAWTDNASDETSFKIERQNGDGSAEGTLSDESGNAHDGTVTQASWNSDATSGYYSFDGADDYISLNTPLLQGSSDFSVSLWFNADSLGSNQALLEGRDANDDGLRISLNTSGGFIISINTHDYFPATTVSAAQWNHLSFVADRDGNKVVYLNGTEIFSGSGDSALSTSSDWLLGRIAYTSAWHFDGDITGLRVYNRLLSAGEASTLFSSGRGAADDAVSTANLELFYSMAFPNGPWSQIDTVTSNVTTYVDSTVTANTTYSYRIRAANGFGNSTYSNIASTNTVAAGGGGGGSAPTAPSDLSITAAVTNQIDLAWTDNASDETSFKIERQNGDGSAEGTLSDESGNAHDGTVTQASWNSDATSGYYSFDGADDYISLNTPLLQGSSDFSVSLWFNADSLGSNQALLEGRDANDDGLRISLNTSGGFIISINTHDYFPATTVSAAQWNHLSFVADRDGNKVVYLNGTEIFSGSGDSALSTSSDWLLGRIAYTSAWHFDGDITGLRVYNRLLSAGEASTLFSSGRGAADDAVSTANLELFYSMAFPNGPWSQIDTVTSNVTTYVDSTVTANTTYSYRIRAANGFGNSTYSNIASTNTVAGNGGAGQIASTTTTDDAVLKPKPIRLNISKPSTGNRSLSVQTAETSPLMALQWNSEIGASYSILYTQNLEENFIPLETGILATPPTNEHAIEVLGSGAHYFIIRKD